MTRLSFSSTKRYALNPAASRQNDRPPPLEYCGIACDHCPACPRSLPKAAA